MKNTLSSTSIRESCSTPAHDLSEQSNGFIFLCWPSEVKEFHGFQDCSYVKNMKIHKFLATTI